MTGSTISRRSLLAAGATLAAGLLVPARAPAAPKPAVTVYKPPT